MNKKGNIDNIAIMVSLFVLAIGVIVGYTIVNSASGAFAGDPLANNLVTNSQTMFVRLGNSGFAFGAFGLFLFNMIGAFLLFTHPIFVIIDILFMPLSILIGALLSNAYETSLATLPNAGNFVVMNFMMQNLPYEIIVIDILVAILAYALVKNR